MTTRHRLTPDERKAVILKAARKVAAGHDNILNMTRQEIANACEVPTSIWTVKSHYPHMADLRAEAVSE